MKTLKNILLFQNHTKDQEIAVHFDQGTFWLTQKVMSDLFGVERSVITKHLKNIFATSELIENSVCAKFAHTAADGKNYQTQYYN